VYDFAYSTSKDHENNKNLGLVVLQSDETIEDDFRRILPRHHVSFHVSRVPSGLEVTRDTLGQMRDGLPTAAGLFPTSIRFHAVGYGCTSGTSVIGADAVARLITSACSTAHVTEPVTALLAACAALGVRRLGFLSPYIEDVSSGLRQVLHDHGIETPVFGSFNEAEEAKVARIDEPSITHAAIQLGQSPSVDALFMSCTNLKTLGVIGQIEQAISKPVLSSNQVLIWHMCRLAGITLHNTGDFGTLFSNRPNLQQM